MQLAPNDKTDVALLDKPAVAHAGILNLLLVGWVLPTQVFFYSSLGRLSEPKPQFKHRFPLQTASKVIGSVFLVAKVCLIETLVLAIRPLAAKLERQ